MRKIAFTLLLFISFAAIVMAQDEEPQIKTENSSPSPDTASIFYTNINNRWPGEKLIRVNDSVLKGFNYFLPTDGDMKLYALTGNAGLAYQSMVFSLPDYQGFRYTPFNFSEYQWNNSNIRYFHLTGPYTNLFYSTGPGKEQLFNVTHSQNLLGGLTIGIDLRIVNSLGLYERQKSDDVTFAGTAQFVNKRENYVVLGNYHNTKLKWRENGGIARLSYFTQNTETDRKRIPINLSKADNLIKEGGIQIRQLLYFAKATSHPVIDSLKSDTLGPKKLHRYYDPNRSNFIRHTFTYTRNSNLYTDDHPVTDEYYQQVLIDSVRTFDSVYYQEIANDLSIEAGVGRTKSTSKAVLLRAGIEHVAGSYKVDSISKTFNRFTPYAYFSANAFGLTKVEGRIWTTQGSPFNGDKGLEGSIMFPGFENTNNWGNLKISASLTIEQPYYLYQYHYSNHFQWENSFGQQTNLSFKALYDNRYFKAGFNEYNLTDYIYLDEEAHPAEVNGSVSVTQLWAYTDVHWGYFETQIYGVFQNSTDASVISLPAFAGRMSVYYNRPLFKRALQFQGGISALYNTAYHANAYMPALRAFYLQNDYKTGNYPYLDAFINIRVKRARMFLQFKHVNSGLMDYTYIMVPGYPMPDRGMRFGISWAFYD
ncbi:MAG TPA: putative porin [Lentimicrobium sp.]|nr:putative porin [Lentimicrobium sp.]